MIVCPMCEHPQAQGDTCDECGRSFGTAREAAPAPVVPVPDIERTGLVEGPVEIAATPMVELDPTAFRHVRSVSRDAVPDLEPTRTDSVDVIPDLMPDLETGRAEEDLTRTPASPNGLLTCRYCRHTQPSGALCDKCGMRLPRAIPPAGAVTAKGRKIEEVWTRCRKCGGRARAGLPCTSCGVPVPEVTP
jgi:hypothetical protein